MGEKILASNMGQGMDNNLNFTFITFIVKSFGNLNETKNHVGAPTDPIFK